MSPALFAVLVGMALVVASPDTVNLDENGNCQGLSVLRSPYGVVVDHWGNGGYKYGSHCRWFVRPEDGSEYLYLHFFNYYALGDMVVRNGSTVVLHHNEVTNTLSDYAGGVGFTFEALFGTSQIMQNAQFKVFIPPEGVYILFASWNSVGDLPRQAERIGVQKDVLILFQGSDNLPGFTLAYYTENSIVNSVVPFCNSGNPIDLVVYDTKVTIADWLWILNQSQISPDTVCKWNITFPNVSELWYTLKAFQPDSPTEQIIISDSNNNTLATFPQDADSYHFTNDRTIYRYDTISDPAKVVIHGNSLLVTFIASTNTHGFVLQVWEAPTYCSESLVIEKIPSSVCFKLTDHTGIGASIGPSRTCRWLIAASNSSSARSWTLNENKLIVFVQELELGSLNTGYLSINTAITKNDPITSRVDQGPPVIAFTQSSFITNYESVEIQYVTGNLRSQGFKILITTLADVSTCLPNVLSYEHLSEGDSTYNSIINVSPWDSPVMRRATHNFYKIYSTSQSQGISHLALNLLYPEMYELIGRYRTISPKGMRTVDLASRTLSLVGIPDVLVLEWKSHLVDDQEMDFFSNQISIDNQVAVPSVSQSGKSLVLRRSAGHPNNTFVSFMMSYRGQQILKHYELSHTDFSTVDISSFHPFNYSTMWSDLPVDSNTAVAGQVVNAYEAYSVTMCRGAVLYSYKKKLTNEQRRNGLEINTGDIVIEIVRKPPGSSGSTITQFSQPSSTSYFGKLLRVTNSCSWIYTSYSPQIDAILSLRNNTIRLENYIVTNDSFFGHAFVLREWNSDGSIVQTVDTGVVADHIRGIYVGCLDSDTPDIQLHYFAYQNRSTLSGYRFLWGEDLDVEENPLTIAKDACELDNNHMAIDTNNDTSLTIIGAKTRQRVYFIWSRYPLDNLPFTFCIQNNLDVHFGSNVQFSAFSYAKQDEIVVTGSKVYILPLQSIIRDRTELSVLSSNFTKCVILDVLIDDLQFVPNRVLYSGETWKAPQDNERLSIAQTTFALLVMKTSFPVTSDQYNNNFGMILVSQPGSQWSNDITTSMLNLKPCPPGSYSLQNHLFCVLCKAGTYQPETGASNCMPCANDSYCPTGSSLELKQLGYYASSFESTQQPFPTKQPDSLSILVSNFILLPTSTTIQNFGAITWTYIILLLVFTIIASIDCRYGNNYRRNIRFIIGLFDPNDDHNIMIKKIDSTERTKSACCPYWNLRCFHSAINIFRVKKTKYPMTGQTSNGVYCLILAFLVIAAVAFSTLVFLDYHQMYSGTAMGNGLNAYRITSYQPFFSATDNVKYAVDYLIKQSFTIEITINGFALADCEDLCFQTTPVLSDGCYYGPNHLECHYDPNITCTSFQNNSSCQIKWRLPDDLEVNRINSFTFNLQNAYIEELRISAYQDEQPIMSTSEKDTLKVIHSKFTDIVQLPKTNYNTVFYGVNRQYEIVYSVTVSEQDEIIISPGYDYFVYIDWNPLQGIFDQGTVSTAEFFSSGEPNTVSVQFSIHQSYILNTEGRAASLSAYSIALIVLLVAIRSAIIAVWSCLIPPLKLLHTRYHLLSKLWIMMFFCCDCSPPQKEEYDEYADL